MEILKLDHKQALASYKSTDEKIDSRRFPNVNLTVLILSKF